MNPSLSPIQRDDLSTRLKDWNIKTIDKVRKGRQQNSNGNVVVKKVDIEIFSGFKPAIEATQLDWFDYIIQGITYMEKGISYMEKQRPLWKVNFKANSDYSDRWGGRSGARGGMITSTSTNTAPSAMAVHKARLHCMNNKMYADKQRGSKQDGGGSSSSEGFCDNDQIIDPPIDSDSDLCDAYKTVFSSKTQLLKSDAVSVALSADVNIDASTAAVVAEAVASINTTAKKHQNYKETRGAEAKGAEARPGPSGVVGPSAASAMGPAVDEYQVYVYDTKKTVDNDKKKKNDEPNYFAGIKKIDNKQDVSHFLSYF